MNAFAKPNAMEQLDLASAFDVFVSAADRLELSHRELHDEVAKLRSHLREKNADLARSLRQTEQIRGSLHRILDALPCGICVVDSKLEKITLVNPEARRLLELSQGIVPDWADLPKELAALTDAGRLAIQGEGDEHELCFERNGKRQWLAVRLTTVVLGETPRSANHGLVLILRDITAFKLAELEREKSRRMMALAEMSTVLAHEIRNPLGSLELLTGLLARRARLGRESRQWVDNMRAGLRSLSATVNNVLRYHSASPGMLVPIHLATALKTGIKFVKPLADQKQVTVELEESLGEAQILADSSSVQQILLNLTSNSLRHTPEGGRIRISASVNQRGDRQFASIQFTDTGSGISPEHLPQIFEPGFSTANQSPGLGLAVCKRIVEQHGGAISVTSRLGQGTTFQLEFPIQ